MKQRAKIADFHATKIDRKIFEPTKAIDNNLPSKENPGPG